VELELSLPDVDDRAAVERNAVKVELDGPCAWLRAWRAHAGLVSVIPVCGCLRRIAFRDPLVSAGRQLARRSGAVPFSLQSG
jgi:hypothetical protein